MKHRHCCISPIYWRGGGKPINGLARKSVHDPGETWQTTVKARCGRDEKWCEKLGRPISRTEHIRRMGELEGKLRKGTISMEQYEKRKKQYLDEWCG